MRIEGSLSLQRGADHTHPFGDIAPWFTPVEREARRRGTKAVGLLQKTLQLQNYFPIFGCQPLTIGYQLFGFGFPLTQLGRFIGLSTGQWGTDPFGAIDPAANAV